jgi:hypothetical protein
MFDINLNPTRKDVKWFCALLLLFAAALGAAAWLKGPGFVAIGIILGVAWLTSLVLNGSNRKDQLIGILLPAMCLTIGLCTRGGTPPSLLASVIWGLGLVMAVLGMAVPAVGSALFRGWMAAGLPIGWTISHLILGVAYYLVLTPIGLLMRLLGHDPMSRRFDADAETYWEPHETPKQTSRYFRQF